MKGSAWQAKDLLEVGRLRKPWGLKGELAVDWFAGTPPVGKGGRVLLKRKDRDEFVAYTVARLKAQGNFFVVAFEDVKDRTAAEHIDADQIWVAKQDLPKLEEGEFYTYQILEMNVYTEAGALIGPVVEVTSTGSNDVYVVKSGDRELLIPAIEDVVVSIDADSKRITIREIEGLLD